MIKKIKVPITMIVAVAPFVTVISCNSANSVPSSQEGAGADSSNQLDDNSGKGGKHVVSYEDKMSAFQVFSLQNQSKLAPITYNKLKSSVDQKLPWTGGVPKFSLSQACSYLYDLALKLGFNEKLIDAIDLSNTPSGDDKLDSLRKETYEKAQTTFGGLKVFDQSKIKEIQSKGYFQGVFLLESVGNQADERHLISNGIDISSFGVDTNTEYTNKDPNGKLFSFPNTTFTSLTGESINLTSNLVASQYIDAQTPGTVNTIIYTSEITDSNDSVLINSFMKKLSTPGLVPIYPTSSIDEKADNLTVLDATLQKLNLIFSDKNSDLVEQMRSDAKFYKVSALLIDALEFLGKNFNVNFSMNDVSQAYDSLNNGSHYFKAVEVFLRGASGINFEKNTVPNWTPQSGDDHSGIINMSIDHLEGALLAWGNRQGNSSFIFENDNFVPNYDFNTYVPNK